MDTFTALQTLCVGNSPVNNREADDLRRYSAHYDVTVMVNTYMLRTANYTGGGGGGHASASIVLFNLFSYYSPTLLRLA